MEPLAPAPPRSRDAPEKAAIFAGSRAAPLSLPPSLRTDTLRSGSARFRPAVCGFPSPGRTPVPGDRFRPKKRVRPGARRAGPECSRSPGSQDWSSSLAVLVVTVYLGRAVGHQDHFNTHEETDVK